MLPAELIDLIFSFLQGNTLALKACSKAHPLFSRLAERHIYAHIVSNSHVCQEIIENPHLLNYPRTLEMRPRNPPLKFIMSVIPRMANLVSLRIDDPYLFGQRLEFLSALKNCFQQSSLQSLYLSHLDRLPFSILDDAKYIKHLTLSNCNVDEDEPIPSSPSSQLSLDTLVFSNVHDEHLQRWAVRWVTCLTLLELCYVTNDWKMFFELLKACSNSLTRLHLEMHDNGMLSLYRLSQIYLCP